MDKDKEFPYDKKIVVIGGGTGSYTLLRGLIKLNNPELISAIPGMWDSGGSTGRIRIETGLLPAGDVRQCMIGLMEDDKQNSWGQRLSQDRFAEMDGPLHGHDVLNLLIDVATKAAGGFQQGVNGIRDFLHIRGNVYPITLMNVDLVSQLTYGPDLVGEHLLDERWRDEGFDPRDKVEAIYLNTPAEANPLALKAIEEADSIVFPAGSLYGSILPHLLVDGVVEALKDTKARLFFVSNLMTQRGQTDTMDKTSHYLKEFIHYLGSESRLDYLVINENGIKDEPLEFYMEKGHQKPVETDVEECRKLASKVKILSRSMATYITKQNLLRHDSLKLAEVILDPEKFVLAP